LSYLWLTTLGFPIFLALPLNLLAGILAGLACEVVAVRPLRWRGALEGGRTELVTTIGLATALGGVFGLVWGYDPLLVPWRGSARILSFAGVRTPPDQVVLVAGSIVVALALAACVRFTGLGQACLAVSEDRQAATVQGINVELLSLLAFGSAGALGALSAFAIGPVTYAVPTLVNVLALGGFVALAIGGEGSFVGCAIGGLLTGVVSAVAVRYLGANYDNLSVLALLLVTLSLRPRGVGQRSRLRLV
jgi:branched-chain amino acid transport system permease protein